MPTDNPQDKQLALITHLLGIITGFLGSLIIWLVKKEQGGFVVAEAKKALNFQLTLLCVFIALVIVSIVGSIILSKIAGILAMLFGFVVWLVWMVAVIANIVFSIKAALAVNKGEDGSYPFSLNLVK